MNGVSISYDEPVPGADHVPKNQLVFFKDEPVRMGKKSEEIGRDYFETVPFIYFVTAGAKDPEFKRKATDADKRKYFNAWARYEAQSKEIFEGTPLEAWPYLNKAQVLNLKANSVHTIEQLSAISDGARLECGIKLELIDKAKLWLKTSEDSAAVNKVDEENRKLKAKIDQLEAQIQDIVAKAEKKLKKD